MVACLVLCAVPPHRTQLCTRQALYSSKQKSVFGSGASLASVARGRKGPTGQTPISPLLDRFFVVGRRKCTTAGRGAEACGLRSFLSNLQETNYASEREKAGPSKAGLARRGEAIVLYRQRSAQLSSATEVICLDVCRVMLWCT